MNRWILALVILAASFPPAQAGFQNAFAEGEQLEFVIRWGVVTAGYSTLSVPSIVDVDGRPAYHILSEARSAGMVDTFYKVKDRNESWLDTRWPRSLGYEKRIHEGTYRVHETVRYDHQTNRYRLTKVRHDKNTHKDREGDVPPNVLDVFSSLYYVRTLPLEVGKTFTIDVHSGEKSWPLSVSVKARERIKVKAGTFDCYRVEPVLREPGIFISKGKSLEVWLTADERRMPVRMRTEVFIGHVSAELVRKTLPSLSDSEPRVAATSPSIPLDHF